jgi:hypothetical protein
MPLSASLNVSSPILLAGNGPDRVEHAALSRIADAEEPDRPRWRMLLALLARTAEFLVSLPV